MTSAAPPGELGTALAAPVEAVLANAKRLDRIDLIDRIETSLQTLAAPAPFQFVVVGEIKRGKSSLLNGILGVPGLLPVDTDVCTAAQIIVEWAAEPRCEIVLADGTTQAATLSTVDEWATLLGQETMDGEVHTVRIGLPNRLLGLGAVLVDTPGINGPVRGHTDRTRAALAGADAALFVLDGDTELTAPELAFANEVTSAGLDVIFVATKRDLPGSDEVVARDWELLEQHAPHLATATLHSVSSTLKSRADTEARDATTDVERSGARELFDLSGFGPFLAQLVHRINARDVIRGQAVLRQAASASEQLLADVERRLSALQESDPDRIEGEVKERIGRLREAAQEGRRAAKRESQRLAAEIDDEIRRIGDQIRQRAEEIVAAPHVEPAIVRQETESGLDTAWIVANRLLAAGAVSAVGEAASALERYGLQTLLDDVRPTIAIGSGPKPLAKPVGTGGQSSGEQLFRYLPIVHAPAAVGHLLGLVGATSAAASVGLPLVGLPILGAAFLFRRSLDQKNANRREAAGLVNQSLREALEGLRSQARSALVAIGGEIDQLLVDRAGERRNQILDERRQLLAMAKESSENRHRTVGRLRGQRRALEQAGARLDELLALLSKSLETPK